MAAHVDSKTAIFQQRDRCEDISNDSFQVNVLWTGDEEKQTRVKNYRESPCKWFKYQTGVEIANRTIKSHFKLDKSLPI